VVRFVSLKVLRALAVIFTVTVLTQFVLELVPGSLAEVILGESATPKAVKLLNHQLGADRPFFTRYFDWLGNAVQGDFGISPLTRERVGHAITQALPVTIELVVLATTIALTMAVAFALLAARAPDSRRDRFTGWISSSALAIPAFVAGPVLAWVFAIKVHWVPVTGWVPLSESVTENLRSAILPAICIALPEYAIYQRILRADLITTLGEDYIEAARARGIRERSILFRHAMRPASVPLITLVGLTVGRLLGGTVIVETLFTLPGLGRLLAMSILSRDLVMVQGIVVVVATMFVLINLTVDLTYGLIDPRIRIRRSA
jgi:peptide/nickel transport system permease protein